MSDKKDWEGEMDAIQAKYDGIMEGIGFWYECWSAIQRSKGDTNKAMEAIRDMLVKMKAAGLDPLTVFNRHQGKA